MRASLLVLSVTLLALVNSDAIIQGPNDLISNSSNVFDDDFSRLLPFHDVPAGALPGPQLGWGIGYPIPEPAVDAVWTRHVCKGKKMMAQMSYSDFDVAQMLPVPKTTVQSPYNFSGLKQWGYWMFGRVSYAYRDFSEGPGKFWGIAGFLKRIEVSQKCKEEGGTWNAALIVHWDPTDEEKSPKEKQTYKGPDGVSRRATGAYYHMAVTPEGGIMTQNRKSPWEALQNMHADDASPTELPQMQRSSEMMWAMWEYYIPHYYQDNIQFFITLSIENPTTLSLMRRALDTVGKELTTNGHKFLMNTDAGKALLSSPNGAGFAHFLIERKAQVGLKRIEFVWVFQCKNQAETGCMVFGVEDLDEPEPRPEDDKAPKDPATVPKESDPNTKENTEEPEKPGVFPGPSEETEIVEPRNVMRSFVRTNMFRMDGRGNITIERSYA